MDFTQEQIEAAGITEDQLPKIKEVVSSSVAELKKEWDGKANTDAERIIQGAVDLSISKMGIEGIQRNDGEKMADFLMRTTPMFVDSALAKERSEITRLKADYETKLKAGGDESTLKELQETKDRLDVLKQKEALFADYETNDYKTKYETTNKELSGLRLNVAYQHVKPTFPDSVNKFEAAAKWNDFIKQTNQSNNIELDENNTPWAVDKENEHKRVKLESLVEKDNVISELAKGREATGLGSNKLKGESIIEGVPFKVPEKPQPAERERLIREYLTTQKGISLTSNEYAKEFKTLNDLILKKN